MDVALQVNKNLPRDPELTIAIIDDYCTPYFFDNGAIALLKPPLKREISVS